MDNKVLTPLKAVRKKCLECSGDKPSLVRRCDSQGCPLYVYRLGKNFKRAGIGGRKALFTPKPLTQVDFSVKEGMAV
jgi:hypothetical protein